MLRWFAGGIGLHRVHHFSPRIPNYALQQCHDDNVLFHSVTTIHRVPPALERDIIVALEAFMVQSSSSNDDEMCRAIERYVDDRRSAACPPEHVVIALRTLTRTAALRRPKDTGLRPDMSDRDLLAEQFISCGIRRHLSHQAGHDAPSATDAITEEMSMDNAHRTQSLEHQIRDFHDGTGRRWRVRIEQGGGRPSGTNGPPAPRLIFSSREDPNANEIAAVGEVTRWELASYSEPQLRALLTEAQARASDRET